MLQLDGTLLIIAISFIFFMFIMQKVFYSPITKVRDEREGYIDNNVQTAVKAKEEAEILLDEYSNKIQQARLKSNKIVSELTYEANKKKSEAVQNAVNNSNVQIDNIKEQIIKEKEEIKESLKPQVVSLAHSISLKILGEDIPVTSIDNETIDKALNEELS